jgi:Entner-Doudoroff aldolase
MTPDTFVTFLGEQRAIAIMRASDAQRAREGMAAAIRGGFRIVEFTLNTPGVLDLIAELAGHDEVVVGAGTVLSVDDARRAVAAGARFLVSPVVDEAVIAAAFELGVAVLPGTHTATEMWRAHRAGAPLQKLFPAAAGGPAYVRALLGPMPFLRIVPTNGVDADNALAYLEAGAHAVGFVTPLFSPADMAERAFERIEARARALLAAVGG